MQVKKFEAPTIQEALNVVKRELGPTAIILSTKQNKNGFGLMSRGSVEVTAAIAEKEIKKKKMAERNLPEEVKNKIWSKSSSEQAKIFNHYYNNQSKLNSGFGSLSLGAEAGKQAQGLRKNKPLVNKYANNHQNRNFLDTSDFIKEDERPQSINITAKRYADIEDDEEISTKVSVEPTSALLSMVSDDFEAKIESGEMNLSPANFKTVDQLWTEVENLKNFVADIDPKPDKTYSAQTDVLDEIIRDLIAAGVNRKLVVDIVSSVEGRIQDSGLHSIRDLQDLVAEQIMINVNTANPLDKVNKDNREGSCNKLAFVGPTGVGKTTTIAKIASQALLEKNLRVGLINFDSYKVAAADHLSTYARIMNVPFRSASSVTELQEALFDFSGLDLVLIDTTGRSQKDSESLSEMKRALETVSDLETALVLSATTRDSDQIDIVNRFKLFKAGGLIFSKLDETGSYGCIYNVCCKTKLPMFYFTTGQRVPEDIEKATKERVAALILDF